MGSNGTLKFAAMFLAGCVSSFASVISVSPSMNTVDQGVMFSLDIVIINATDLYSYQFDLGFDPSVLSSVDVLEGGFLLSGGPTFFIPGVIDNVAGTISFTANVLLGAVPGVTGDGSLATVQFLALAPGISPVTLSSVILQDSNLVDITATVVDGSVEVTANGVPEPSSRTLILLGMSVIGGVCKFRRRIARESASTRSSTGSFRAA